MIIKCLRIKCLRMAPDQAEKAGPFLTCEQRKVIDTARHMRCDLHVDVLPTIVGNIIFSVSLYDEAA